MTEVKEIPGLFYCPDQISTAEMKQLSEFLDTLTWKPLSASKNSRVVQHYGFAYDYKDRNIRQPTDPIPLELMSLRNRLTELCETLLLKQEFNQCIVNNYNPGQGISPHVDVRDYGPVIGCFSLGESPDTGAMMRFTNPKNEHHDLWVEAGSLYIMSGEARYRWKHSMPSRFNDEVHGENVARDRRISVTFRHVPPFLSTHQ